MRAAAAAAYQAAINDDNQRWRNGSIGGSIAAWRGITARKIGRHGIWRKKNATRRMRAMCGSISSEKIAQKSNRKKQQRNSYQYQGMA